MYTVRFTGKPKRFLKRTSPFVRSRIEEAIPELAENPRGHPQTAPLGGALTGLWRLRVGDYRLIFEIDDRRREVTVVGIRHRREAYR
jgi:mRNA interferase RelE/StbE